MRETQSLPRLVDARWMGSATTVQSLLAPTTVEIAFGGRSNVGKSSLLNALLGHHHLARTSSTPGCTRALGFLEARFSDGSRIQLVDLPGYGYARRSHEERKAWSDLVEGYLRERITLRTLVLLVDIRRGLEADDQALCDWLRSLNNPVRPPVSLIVVATKIDRWPLAKHRARLTELRRSCNAPVLGLTVKAPETIQPLWRALVDSVTTLPVKVPAPPHEGSP